MSRFFHQGSGRREIYFHEDDYCQQELLPRDAAAWAAAELKASGEFADAHRAPGGVGWTEMYVIKAGPVELGALRITKEEFAGAVAAVMPPFDRVLTGYSTYSEVCPRTAAWGRSEQCALLADWDDAGIVTHAWAEFFEQDDESIEGATGAVAALGKIRPLIYVDWAWGYLCEASDEQAFAKMLRTKLRTIAEKA